MELQTAFYIIGIIFMSLMIIMFIALLSMILVIKSKIGRLHNLADQKINQAKSVAGKVGLGLDILRRFVKK